jgi:hypothetical protein
MPLPKLRSMPLPKLRSMPLPKLRSMPLPKLRSMPLPKLRSTPSPKLRSTHPMEPSTFPMTAQKSSMSPLANPETGVSMDVRVQTLVHHAVALHPIRARPNACSCVYTARRHATPSCDVPLAMPALEPPASAPI